MHELSLAQALLDTALRHPSRVPNGRILRVEIRVGTLAGVDVDSLTFCFELSSKGTDAEGAEVRVEVTPPVGRCRACRAERVLEVPGDLGPWASLGSGLGEACECGERQLDLVGGHELTLVAMEVEEGGQ